jgi:hypothetical protein
MQNQLNGAGGRRQVLSSVDFYRRVPKDLTEVRSERKTMSPWKTSACALFLCV